MLSKSQLSFIKSIHLKKFRVKHRLFIVEGYKSISEFLSSKYILSQLFFTSEMASKVANFPQKMKSFEITSSELEKISTLKSPNGMLALFQIPTNSDIEAPELSDKFSLVLDCIQDPGNLGTIIRTADWFGIENIICSLDSADCFNPKVVQATMGSLSRVSIHYRDLSQWLPQTEIKIYGALLDGISIYTCDFKSIQENDSFEGTKSSKRSLIEMDDSRMKSTPPLNTYRDEKNHGGLILLGNEGQGIGKSLLPFINQAITIPRFGSAESLNVAIAAALICSEIRRHHP